MTTVTPPSVVEALLRPLPWTGLDSLYATKETQYWIYSLSASLGPRMMFNVPQRMLDDILSGTGAVAMAKDRIRICDFYLMQVEDFESRATLAEKESMKGQMSIALLALLLDQGAWSTLAKTKLDGEKHLLVMDWGHKASRRSSHAIFQTPAGTLPSQDDLLTVSMQLYEKNYARQC